MNFMELMQTMITASSLIFLACLLPAVKRQLKSMII